MDIGPEHPLIAGLGALLVAAATALTKWAKAAGAKDAAISDVISEEELELEDASMTLEMNVHLQTSAQAIGGKSALLLLWEPTPKGGIVTVLAEWPGNFAPSALKYQQTELGETYKRDVINPLVRDRWVIIGPSDLTDGSPLSDLYERLEVGVGWIHLVLRDDDGTVLYVSVRFGEESLEDESVIRDEIRKLTTTLAHVLK